MPRSQFSDKSIPFSEAVSLCGPAAALAFAETNGRAPTLAEARDLAKQVGWTAEGGMNGFQNQVRLLSLMREKGLVGDFEAAPQPDWQRVTQEARSGRPVTISTPRHYFTVSGVGDKGYFVGTSGTDLKGGKEWMTAEEIASHGRGINGALYVTPTDRARQQFVEANTPQESTGAVSSERASGVAQPGRASEASEVVGSNPAPADPLSTQPDPMKEGLQGMQGVDAFSRKLAGRLNEMPTELPRYRLPGLPRVSLRHGPSPYTLPGQF
jgi:hypothetical protein